MRGTKISIVEEISKEFKSWKPNRKPDLCNIGVFFEDDGSIENEHKMFNESIRLLKQGDISFYVVGPDFLEREFRALYAEITGEVLPKYHIQENDKQSVSIRITVWYNELTEIHDLNLPFGAKFYSDNIEVTRWVCNSTKLAMYLVAAHGYRL